MALSQVYALNAAHKKKCACNTDLNKQEVAEHAGKKDHWWRTDTVEVLLLVSVEQKGLGAASERRLGVRPGDETQRTHYSKAGYTVQEPQPVGEEPCWRSSRRCGRFPMLLISDWPQPAVSSRRLPAALFIISFTLVFIFAHVHQPPAE